MDKLSEIKAKAGSLSLTHTKGNMELILKNAESANATYLEFLSDILQEEINCRNDKAKTKRIKEAGFPYIKKLEDFDLGFCKSLTEKQSKQLSELTWIEGLYNLILAGPPGVGKTHLSIALAYHACEEGYKASYTNKNSLA